MRRSLVLVALLATAQTGPATLAQTRQAFLGCLRTVLHDSLHQHISQEEFAARLAPSCSREENAFRSAAVAVDLAAGLTRAAAERGVTFAVNDMRDEILESYMRAVNTDTQAR